MKKSSTTVKGFSKDLYREEVNKLIQKLHERELRQVKKSGDSIHTGASIQPKADQNSTEAVVHMDAIARLITDTVKDTCTAVCFDGKNLLLSSNERTTSPGTGLLLVKQYMPVLRNFVNEPSESNYRQLEEYGISRTRVVKKEISKDEAQLSSLAKVLRNRPSGYSFLKELQKDGGNIEELYQAATAVINDDGPPPLPPAVKNLASDILRPIVDTRIIARAVINGELGSEVINAISTGKWESIDGEKHVHAEMKIIDYLEKKGELKQGNTFNIGVTKLACCPCYLARHRAVELKAATINIAGTHGGTYMGWAVPNFLLEDQKFLQELTALGEAQVKIDKLRESVDVTNADLDIMQVQCWLEEPNMAQYKATLPAQPSVQASNSNVQSSRDQKISSQPKAQEPPYTDKEIITILSSQTNPSIRVMTGNLQQKLVSNTEQLQLALDGVKIADNGHYVIPMRVNIDTSNFGEEGAEGDNKHFVGVHVLKDRGKVTQINYVDPTGELCNEEILAGLSDKKAKGKTLKVESYEIKLLYSNPEDSGPLMVYMLQQVASGDAGIEELQTKGASIENWSDSRELAKRLRETQLPGKHLKRAGKGGGEAYDIRESFAASNTDNLDLLEKMRKEAVITADIDLKAVDVKEKLATGKVGKVEFLAEGHHIQDHAQNTQSLIERIESGDIDKDTVIAIERKSYGGNLGVPDVIMLASILEHNEKNPDKQLKIPAEITKDSLIYQDAILYNTAKKHGVKVVGLEGRNLKAGKELPEEYNAAREDYMASRITQLTDKGYNVIAYVGSAHVDNLKRAVENKPDVETGLKAQPNKLTEELQMMAASIGQQARGYVSQSTTTMPSIPVLPNEKQTIKPNSVIGGRE